MLHRTGWSHPFLQTIFMFVGETLCLGAFAIYWFTTSPDKRDKIKEGFNPLILAVSAAAQCGCAPAASIELERPRKAASPL